jgi:catechol 2,3-dioxygenase-like lactoylglutathione lyase family enzyme
MSNTSRERFAHVGIVTCDIDRAITTIANTLGLRFPPPITDLAAIAFADRAGNPLAGLRRVTTSLDGPMRVELLEGEPGSTWFTTEETRLHHVAYSVTDVAAAVAARAADDWRLEITLAHPTGEPNGFAYLVKDGEARIELTLGDG